jgi:hypothetical protein
MLLAIAIITAGVVVAVLGLRPLVSGDYVIGAAGPALNTLFVFQQSATSAHRWLSRGLGVLMVGLGAMAIWRGLSALL